jgi:LacI family transcriptional regulator
MKRRVKMADIAKQSGVSTSTVSLVLRNKPGGIPPETRQRVKKVAQRLGYRPRNSTARSHPLPVRLHSIGLIVKSEPGITPQANPFYSHVLAGIEETCRQKKINLLYATLPVDENNNPVEVPRLLEENTDGLLLVGAFLDGALAPVLEQKAAPIVLVDAYATWDKYYAVVSDNVHGAFRAVSYLIERGHRHIGLIGSHPDAYPSLRERREGYLQALREHGIAHTYFANCALKPECACESARLLLSQQPQITAVFGCNDEVALAAMRAAQALGRQSPRDLSVVGFDDIDLAQHVTPSLTTMHVDKVGMGHMAVQLLINRVERPDAERITSVIRPRLIERESVSTHIPGGS